MPKIIGLLICLLFLARPSMAGCHCTQVAEASHKRFVISALIRQNSSAIQVKLLQAQTSAHNEQEAIGQFTQTILSKFPHSSVLDILAAEVADGDDACERYI